MNFFKTLLGGIPENGVLTATFRVDDDFRFQLLTKVGFGFTDKDYLQLFLNYYLRTLINLKSSPASHVLRATFEKVILEGFSSKSNILQIAEIDDVVSIQKYSPANAREYVATITIVPGDQRSCFIKLPKGGYEQDMVFSVFVMLQNLVDILDDYHLDFLKEACSRLVVGMYNETELKRNGLDFETASGSRLLAASAINSVESLVKQRQKEKIAKAKLSVSHSVSNTTFEQDKIDLSRKKQNQVRFEIQSSLVKNKNSSEINFQESDIFKGNHSSTKVEPAYFNDKIIGINDSDKIRVRQLMRDAHLLKSYEVKQQLNYDQLIKWTKKENSIEAYFIASYLEIPHYEPNFTDPTLNLKLKNWLDYARS
jgi:hypothetical protein